VSTRTNSLEYRRWLTKHRGFARRPEGGYRPRKVSHRWWVGALWHRVMIVVKFRDTKPMSIYRCRWHDDFRLGETARPHWHVGRTYKYGRPRLDSLTKI